MPEINRVGFEVSVRCPAILLVAVICCFTVAAKPKRLDFSASCQQGERVTLAFVGDVLLHKRLQNHAQKQQDRYLSLWRPVLPFLARANIVYANLEGPVGELENRRCIKRLIKQQPRRAEFPRLLFPPALLDDLSSSGVSVVSTANNHAFDHCSAGIDETITQLRRVGIQHTGTRMAQEKSAAWHTVVSHGEFRIAFIACSYWANMNPDPRDQVLSCYWPRERRQLLRSIAELSASERIDAVIVTPHWGVEQEKLPNAEQKKLARQMVQAGATAVIGSHPHVLQPLRQIRRSNGADSLVAYSLGNFVTGYGDRDNRLSLVLFLALAKCSGHAEIAGLQVLPLYLDHSSHRTIPLNEKTLLPRIERVVAADHFVFQAAEVGVLKE